MGITENLKNLTLPNNLLKPSLHYIILQTYILQFFNSDLKNTYHMVREDKNKIRQLKNVSL
jgi:hypothetical protein